MKTQHTQHTEHVITDRERRPEALRVSAIAGHKVMAAWDRSALPEGTGLTSNPALTSSSALSPLCPGLPVLQRGQ